MKRTTKAIALLIGIAIASPPAGEAARAADDRPGYRAIWKIIDTKRRNQATAVAVGATRVRTNAHVLYEFVRMDSTALVLTREREQQSVDIVGPIAVGESERAERPLGGVRRGRASYPEDLKKAAYWPEEAAKQGEASEQRNTAIYYFNGEGVARDFENANAWLDRAVKSGYADAEHDLGVVYRFGEGVPKDVALARYWFGQAADRGHAQGTQTLAEIEASGGN